MDRARLGKVHPLLFATDIERRERRPLIVRPGALRDRLRKVTQVSCHPPDSLLDRLSLELVAQEFTDVGDRACHRDRLAGAETSHLV